MKSCSKCKESKSLDSFYYYSKKNRYYSRCKSCHSDAQVQVNRNWRRDNPAEFRRRKKEVDLKYKYGLTLDQVTILLEAQDYSCAICKAKLEIKTLDKSTRFNVDHDHKTGKVRGLLCLTCNMGLGLFKDSIENLDNAKKYLLK